MQARNNISKRQTKGVNNGLTKPVPAENLPNATFNADFLSGTDAETADGDGQSQ